MIVVQAGAAARVLEDEQPHVREALEALAAIEVTGRETVDEMRRLLGVPGAPRTGPRSRPSRRSGSSMPSPNTSARRVYPSSSESKARRSRYLPASTCRPSESCNRRSRTHSNMPAAQHGRG